MGAKPFRIRVDKIDGFLKIYDGISYLVLFGKYRWHNEIFDSIKYLVSEKSGIGDIY